ncbi:hypothetical protein BDV32DRAFT_124574 [Aspergillus pseudonomiae]|nr:hypothetical protein BDV32DRAFT_124574 [Aspergillus pseudonomiae]
MYTATMSSAEDGQERGRRCIYPTFFSSLFASQNLNLADRFLNGVISQAPGCRSILPEGVQLEKGIQLSLFLLLLPILFDLVLVLFLFVPFR